MSCEFLVRLDAAVFHSWSQFYLRQSPDGCSRRLVVVEDVIVAWVAVLFLNRVEKYLNGKREESARDIPLLFVASPSAKDPTWEERSPGTATGSEAELAQKSRWLQNRR